MTKTLIVILFLTGFFAGLAGGLLWGFTLSVHYTGSALETIATDQTRIMGELRELQQAVDPPLADERPAP